jgi:hypothetical protein
MDNDLNDWTIRDFGPVTVDFQDSDIPSSSGHSVVVSNSVRRSRMVFVAIDSSNMPADYQIGREISRPVI